MITRRSLACAVLLSCAPAAAAWQLDYRLDLVAEYADNIARRPEAVAETVLAPRIGLALTEQTERVDIGIAGDLERRIYLRDRFDDETLARLGINANWRMVDDRLSFAVLDSLADLPVDTFRVDAPDNRQRVNVFLAGPSLVLRPSPTTRVQAELRFGDTYAERTLDFNSQRVAAGLRGLFEIDERSTLSGNLEWSDVRFDEDGPLSTDYRRADAYVRYDRLLPSRGDWSADLGASRIDFDADAPGDGSATRPLLRLRAAYEIQPGLRAEGRLLRQFSDAAQDLVETAPRVEDFDRALAARDIRVTTVSALVFREDGASIGLSRDGGDTRVRLDAIWRRQRYESDPALDQDLVGWSVVAQRIVRPTLTAGLFAGGEERDFVSAVRTDRDLRYGMRLEWQRSERLAFGLQLSGDRRRSDDPTQPYTDKRVQVTVSYRR